MCVSEELGGDGEIAMMITMSFDICQNLLICEKSFYAILSQDIPYF